MIAPGDVDPETKRVALTLKGFHSLGADINGYWFIKESAAQGLDPWRLVEGLDPHTDGKAFDVWFASGSMVTLPVSDPRVIFVASKDAPSVTKSAVFTVPNPENPAESSRLIVRWEQLAGMWSVFWDGGLLCLGGECAVFTKWSEALTFAAEEVARSEQG